MYKDSKYSSSSYDLPIETSWEEKQKPEYSRRMCEFMYSQHLRNMTAISYSEQEKFNQLRLMASGNQPVDWYKSWLSGGRAPSNYGIDNFWTTTRTDVKKGYMNLDWSIISLFPKIISIILSIIKNIDYNLKVDVIDPMSGAEEEDKMIRAYVRTLFGEAIDNAINKPNGLPLPVDEISGTYQELEQIKAEGGFKAAHAVEMAKLLKWTEEHSEWDEHIYENVILDLVTLSSVSVMEDFDYETRTSKWKYVNSGSVICQYSDKKNHDDSDFKGYVDKIRISELMKIFPDVKKDVWIGLAKKFIGYEKNPSPMNWETYQTWESFYVPVLHGFWVDVKRNKYIRNKTKDGNERYYKYDRSKNYLLNDKKSVVDNTQRIAFGCKWVIGSKEFMWDYGVLKNQARPNRRKPMLPLHIYRLPYKSLVERITPIMHQLQIAWLKYQNALMTAHPGGIAVDINMINNITDGGKRYPVMKLINMWFEKGFLPYKLSMTGKYEGGSPVPIHNIPSDLIAKLNDYLTVINNIGKFIEELTGFSTVALGSTPTKDQQVGTTELAYSATLNSLKHFADAGRVSKQFLATMSAERIRIYADVDRACRKVYESVIGKSGMDKVMAAKKRMVQYGIKTIARPDKIEKQGIFSDIELSYQNHLKGEAGINMGQKIRLRAMINQGMDILFIGQIMDAWKAQDERKKERKAKEDSQMQGQVLVQHEREKSKSQYEMEKIKAQMEDFINQNKIAREEEKDIKVEKVKQGNDIRNRNKDFEEQLMGQANESTDTGRKV